MESRDFGYVFVLNQSGNSDIVLMVSTGVSRIRWVGNDGLLRGPLHRNDLAFAIWLAQELRPRVHHVPALLKEVAAAV